MARRRWKVIIALGALALLALVGWSRRDDVWGPPNGISYRTAPVVRGDIASYVSATGTLNPVIMVQVGTQVSGTIEQLFADYNTTVHAGQPLAQLKQASFRAKRVQAEANLDTARAEVKNAQANVHNLQAAIENARAEIASKRAHVERARVMIADAQRVLERQRALFERRLLSRHDADTAQTAHDVAMAQQSAAQADTESAEAKLRAARAQLLAAEAQVEKAKAQVSQAQAAVTQAQVDLDHTIILSPINGTVISRSVDVGQTVAASLQAPTLFTIAQDLRQMQVDTNVSEADIGQVATGQSATFTVDAYAGQVMQGTVRTIRSAPIIVQSVVNYNAVLAVENPDLKLKPGMTATVSILVAQRQDVMKVPKAALRFQPPLTPQEREQFILAWQEQQGVAVPGGGGGLSEAQRRQWQTAPKVWLQTPGGWLQPLLVRLGIADDHFSELQDTTLDEGQELIVGLGEQEGSGTRNARPASNSRRPPPVRF